MLKINGKEKGQYIGISAEEMLKKEQYAAARVAVELNGAILPRSAYGETVLKSGDTVEVVSFVGGG